MPPIFLLVKKLYSRKKTLTKPPTFSYLPLLSIFCPNEAKDLNVNFLPEIETLPSESCLDLTVQIIMNGLATRPDFEKLYTQTVTDHIKKYSQAA
jgi:hypothetical protein